MEHITAIRALSTAAKIHSTGETWINSIEKAFTMRKLINEAITHGYSKEELIQLLFNKEQPTNNKI